MLSPPSLFNNKKEIYYFLIFVIFILIIRFALFYVEYIDFKKKEIYYKNLFVQKFFRLNNKNIVRAKDKKGRVFYIILNKNYYLKSDDLVRVRIYPKESSFYFLDYLHYLYIKGEIIGKISYSSLKANLKKKIFNIHKNRDIAQFYSAIFLAYPIFSSLREKLSALGISHLIAISGFHLGIIYFVIFLLFGLIYSFFHKRLFPFRDKQRDIGIIAIGMVFLYSFFISFPPSVARSFVMLFIIYIAFLIGIEIFSFLLLLFVSAILILIDPLLIFEIGFWFSIAGVFYIYLILKYIHFLNKFLLAVLISFFVYFLMFPIVHLFFYNFTIYQLFSPFISLIFLIFYPLSIVLHLFGAGNIFDPILNSYFNLAKDSIEFRVPYTVGFVYIIFSFLAIKRRIFFYLILALGISMVLLATIRSILQ